MIKSVAENGRQTWEKKWMQLNQQQHLPVGVVGMEKSTPKKKIL